MGYKNYGEILDILNITNNENMRELVGRIKRGISWKQISRNYNIPTESYGNPIVFTDDQIHNICRYIANGYSNIDTLRYITNDNNANTITHKAQYDAICKIKTKKNYTYISNQYF